MSRLRIAKVNEFPEGLLKERWPETSKTEADEDYVMGIIDDVKDSGDSALLKFTKEFDKAILDPSMIPVDESEVDEAYAYVTREQVNALKESITRLKLLSQSILERMSFEVAFKGLSINIRTSPIGSVGCYVPGGAAKYPSSVLMCVVPATVAGVKRIVVTTPPNQDGSINPLTLVACDLTGVSEIYRVGGAHAIAALAYGTETIEPVVKIVGPGNRYVTTAKRLVTKDIPIDMPAGPSELVIIADSTSNPRTIALDLISQAEHDSDAKIVLVTGSKSVAEDVHSELEELLKSSDRQEIIEECLNRNGLIFLYDSLEEGIRFVNAYAPEHLMIISEYAPLIRKRIRSAGLVLIGSNSPVAASDYMLGVNHVLPTNGYAKGYSGLSVLDFVTVINEVECSKKGLSMIEHYATLIAEYEGLSNHARSIRGRG